MRDRYRFLSPVFCIETYRFVALGTGRCIVGLFIASMLVASSATSAAAQGADSTSASIDVTLFALTLAGIGIFHRYSLQWP